MDKMELFFLVEIFSPVDNWLKYDEEKHDIFSWIALSYITYSVVAMQIHLQNVSKFEKTPRKLICKMQSFD